MRRKNIRLFFLVGLFGIVSCTFEPVKMSSLGTRPGICQADPDTGLPTLVSDGSTENVNLSFRDFAIQIDGPVRMNYSPYATIFQNVGVTGTFPDGSDYFIRIDSGFPWYLGLTDTIVVDHNLPVCAISDITFPIGLCKLDSLKIGEMTITNPPSIYFEQHWELQLLGMPVWKERAVLIGLRMMEKFSYILFDNRRGEVEFGGQDSSFDPGSGKWSSYPITVDADPQNQRRLMVSMPIAGEPVQVWFDTGNPGGIEMSSAMWKQIQSRVNVASSQHDTVLYWQFGSVECEKMKVAKLPFGSGTLKNTEIVVLDGGKPFYSSYAAIGMGVFDKKVVVIDFLRKLLWVKG